MRRSSWMFLIASILACTPLLAHAASVLTPIINGAGGDCTCPGTAPDWGCVLETFQNVINDLVAFATIIITLFIAWAGFGFIMSPTNAEGRTKARTRLVNAVLGLLITLCAWLLISSLLGVIYNASASAGDVTLGQWDVLLTANNTAYCIKPVTVIPPLPGLVTGNNNSTPAAGTAGTPSNGASAVGNDQCPGSLICSTSGQCILDPQLDNGNGAAGAACNTASPNCGSGLVCDNTGVCSTTATSPVAIPSCTYVAGSAGKCTAPSAGACSVSALQSTCFASRAQQASVICNQESAGGNTFIESGTDLLNGGSGPSYSVGIWQINLTTSPVGGLPCPSAFTGQCASGSGNLIGSSHPGWCTASVKSDSQSQVLYSQCVTAAQNATTNTQVACSLYTSQGDSFQPWTHSANLCSVPKTS